MWWRSASTGIVCGVPLGWGRRRQAVDRMLEAVDARHFADARVGNLSGGEQQRVLIAHALISRPRLLLLDEPLANLDIRAEGEVVALLARIAREQRIAVLISAHDVNPLLPVMDRFVYVAAGRTASGTTEEVIRADVLSALYGQHVDVLRVHGRILVVAGAEGRAGVTLEETEPRAAADPRRSRCDETRSSTRSSRPASSPATRCARRWWWGRWWRW